MSLKFHFGYSYFPHLGLFNFIVLRIASQLAISLDNRAGMIGTSWEKNKWKKVRNVGEVHLASFIGNISENLESIVRG